MPWFKIDDSAHSHPKFVRATNAALGLWLRCGAYSAQHLLEGRVPGFLIKSFGTPAQAKKLVAAGLWHLAGHDCPRCPQPADGDYMIHDFFEGGRNSTRAQVEASRKNAAERQARARAKAAELSAETPMRAERDANGAPLSAQRDANGARTEPHFQGSAAGQEGSSRRDAMDSVTPSLAKPVLPSPSEKEKEVKTASYAPADGEGAGPQIPAASQPLVDALQAERLFVGWDLRPGEWLQIEALIRRCGIPVLVTSARASWQGARDTPRSGRYFLPAWKAMAAATSELPGSVVPFRGPGQSRPSTTDQRVNDALALAAEFRALEGGTA